jgi:hypothetical protein
MSFDSLNCNLIKTIKRRGNNETSKRSQLKKLNKNPRFYGDRKRLDPDTASRVPIYSRIPHLDFERVNYEEIRHTQLIYLRRYSNHRDHMRAY